MVNKWSNIIQHTFFPPSCILCGNDGWKLMDLCHACHNELTRNETFCICCAQQIAADLANDYLCGECQNAPPAFDKAYAPYIYQGTIRYLINQFKFNGRFQFSRLIGQLMSDHLMQCAVPPELIIPIPLHSKRYRERGFNQSLEIAKIISHNLNIPINNTCSRRIKNTAHQTRLTSKERKKNIKNAFQIRAAPQVKHVAIIDDVLTTGSTANELAKELKLTGVKRVDVWVCARA